MQKVSAEYEIVYDSMGMQVFDSTGEEILAPMDGGEMAYRCYFRQSDGDKEIVNEFAVDDLAQCREFNGLRYWKHGTKGGRYDCHHRKQDG